MTVDLHHRVHDGFLDIAASNPDRCVIVNAEGSETAVQAEIQNVVSARLGVAGDGA
jgi:dTMP kinase